RQPAIRAEAAVVTKDTAAHSHRAIHIGTGEAAIQSHPVDLGAEALLEEAAQSIIALPAVELLSSSLRQGHGTFLKTQVRLTIKGNQDSRQVNAGRIGADNLLFILPAASWILIISARQNLAADRPRLGRSWFG